MPDNIPASFIPKKSTTIRRTTSSARISLFFSVSVIIFVIALASSIGVFLYGGITKRNIESKAASLERAKEAFEISLIEELSRLDDRIESSGQILGGHVVLTTLFNALGDATLKSVKFDTFDLYPDENGEVKIILSGVARDYASIVLQSEVLAENRFFKNIIFSNLGLNDFGDVTFDIEATVDDSLISFEDNIQ
jgi:hypothetical protein